MEQKPLAKWLKCILIGFAICLLIIYAMVFPTLGMDLRTQYPEFSNRFWPWLIFIWASGIPCYAVLGLSWKIVTNISHDQSFSEDNAKLFKWISALSAGDVGLFFIGNVLLFLLNMSHPGIVLASSIVVFVGVAIAVASAALSHLVAKASILQEQSDWTI